MNLKETLGIVQNFPKPGIQFIDITTLLSNPKAFQYATDEMEKLVKNPDQLDGILAIEARGFVFAAPIAQKLELPLIMVRKSGKLPRPTTYFTLKKEYGEDALTIQNEDIKWGGKYLVVDDVLATGGTVQAVQYAVKKMHGKVVQHLFLAEISGLLREDTYPLNNPTSLLRY